MINAVVFDFDGTIADTLPIIIKNANKLSEEFGIRQIKYSEKLKDKSLKELIKQFKIPLSKLLKFVKKAKKILAPELKKAKVFKGMKKAIDELSKQYLIGILTSNSKTTVQKVLEKAKIAHVDFIFSDKSIFGKHVLLKKLMKKKNLAQENVVYIGDEIRDITAGRKAGIKTIAVLWGYNSEKALKKHSPDFIAEKPSRISLILDKIDKN